MQDGSADDAGREDSHLGDAPLGDFTLPDVEIRREVAHGGFAVVYEAFQTALNRTVAVKILAAQVRDDTARVRFERECVAMGLLSDHPHIVTVFDAGFAPSGQPYILMDFMPGGTLADRVARDGRIDWQEVVRIGVKLSAALEMAHRAGILHRDIKPENILLSAYGEPELGDFGIARLQGGPETGAGTLTASIAHAAPELLAGDPPSVHTDLYALGSTLFALASGRPAFVRDTDESILPAMARITSEPVPDVRSAGVPSAVATVIERLMAKEPDERFASAVEVAYRLQDVQRELGLPVTRVHVADDTSGATGRVPTRDRTGEVGPPPAPTGAGLPSLAAGRAAPPPLNGDAGASPPGQDPPGQDTASYPAGSSPEQDATPGQDTAAHPAASDPTSATAAHADASPDQSSPPGTTSPSPPGSETVAATLGTPPPGSPGADPPRPRRRRLALILGSATAIAVAVVAGVLLLGGQQAPTNATDDPDAVDPTPSPTPSPTPTPTQTQDPAEGEGDVLDAARIAGQVAAVRGLEAPDDLDARRFTSGAYRPLIRDFAGGSQAGVLDEEGRVLAALHLVPADMDYAETVRGLWEEQLPGFYDQGRIHVRSDTPRLSPLSNAVLADETIVAMIDAAFAVGTLHDQATDLDADRALTTLLKGDTFVTSAAWRERFLTEAEKAQLAADQGLQPDAAFRSAPQPARAEIVFPFLVGNEFVAALLAEGGQDAVDAAYADPPTTTEQVIHPERYIDREPALAVTVAADPGSGWDPLTQRTFGEYDLRQLFGPLGNQAEAPATAEQIASAAAGWGGGQLRAWTRGEDTAVAVWLEFDTPGDGEEACARVEDWYLSDEAAGGAPAGDGLYTTDTDAMALHCDAATVRFAVAPDPDLAADLIG